MSTVLDINRLETLPGPEALERIGRAARDVAGGQYGWDRLVERIKSMTPEEKGI